MLSKKRLTTILRKIKPRLKACDLCPRRCGVNRTAGDLGFCRTSDRPSVGAICNHSGEEPPISGVLGSGTIFFSGCNLRCTFCQNWQISQYKIRSDQDLELPQVGQQILKLFSRQPVENLSFVSPTHTVVQMLEILKYLVCNSPAPEGPCFSEMPVIYNSNGYDLEEVICSLEGIVDIYLPDFKYGPDGDSRRLSMVPDYTRVACRAIAAMIEQVGFLTTDKRGVARRGVLIRHLVLPNRLADSMWVLRYIRDSFGQKTPVSLMAQYYPTPNVRGDLLMSRTISYGEYNRILEEVDRLGLILGWQQELSSNFFYRPDFEDLEHPFESEDRG